MDARNDAEDRATRASVPEISIGMPVFNGARFIRQAIDSLLTQTMSDFELIISDNHSTDETEMVCNEYVARDPRVRYVRHPLNRGAVWNWNYVVSQARGSFFKWASCNDYCAHDMLEKCIAIMRADSRVVLCYGYTTMIDDDGSVLNVYERDIEVVSSRPSQRFLRIREELLMNNAQSGLIRLRPLRKTGLEPEYPGGDMILMAEIALHGTYRLIREPLLFRRIGSTSITRNLGRAELLHFINPMRRSDYPMPTWRRNLHCVRCAVRAPLSIRERLATLGIVARHTLRDRSVMWEELRSTLMRQPQGSP